MPSLAQAVNADLSGYTPVQNPTNTNQPTPSTNMQPGRSAVMRCPLPILGAATPDALRSYFLDGQVPQVRLMTPQTTAPSTASGSTTTFSSSSSSGGGSGTALATSTATITTATIGPSSKFTGVIQLSRTFQLVSIAVNGPARIELYGTATAQTSDISRGLDVAPGAGTLQNIICDVVLDTLPYQWSFQNRTGANGNSPQTPSIYVTITNLAATSAALTVTLTYVPLVN